MLHCTGWQSLAGGESPSEGDSTSSPRRHKLRKFAKKLSLKKTSKSDYKAVQERYGPESHPLAYLPLVVGKSERGVSRQCVPHFNSPFHR